MSLFLDDGDVRLYHGDALTVLQGLPAESVHMCVTSPPFYGLRDYGTGRWEGGNPGCDHIGRTGGGPPGSAKQESNQGANAVLRECQCGATRVDQQIGLEPTPEEWVASLVAVFREVRRVLRDDGTLWLEVGDSYNGGPPPGNRGQPVDGLNPIHSELGKRDQRKEFRRAGIKHKDLIGAPWQLAFALRADGWYLRSDIVWARPNPMPESVTDRPTKSHSYVFLLAKQPRYFFDQEAVRETTVYTPEQIRKQVDAHQRRAAAGRDRGEDTEVSDFGRFANRGSETHGAENGRNVRSVWNIATQPYPEAHFATFPEELARRCILAGTSERGCCPECGAPWIRQTEPSEEYAARQAVARDGTKSPKHLAGSDGFAKASLDQRGHFSAEYQTTGWRLACVHDGHRPCVVLDPFVGSGTVPYVARKHGRHAIGIDLSASYLELAARRLQQLSLFAQPPEPEPVAPTTRPGRSPINPYGYRGHGPKDAANPYSPYREQKGPTPNG